MNSGTHSEIKDELELEGGQGVLLTRRAGVCASLSGPSVSLYLCLPPPRPRLLHLHLLVLRLRFPPPAAGSHPPLCSGRSLRAFWQAAGDLPAAATGGIVRVQNAHMCPAACSCVNALSHRASAGAGLAGHIDARRLA